MENSFSSDMAADVIKTALQSGAVKLMGLTGAALSEPAARARADIDAAYLVRLLSQLTSPPTPKP